jgi:hypothetical protein
MARLSGREYLRYLQLASDRVPGQRVRHAFDEVARWRGIDLPTEEALTGVLGKPSTEATVIDYVDGLVRETLVGPLLRAVPEDVADRLRDVAVGVIPTRRVNGLATRAPNGDFVVALTRGLLMAVSHLAELTYGIRSKATQEGVDAASAELSHAYDFIADYFASAGRREFELPRVKLTPEEMLNVQVISLAQELFVLAHEFAHAALGHLKKPVGISHQALPDGTIVDLAQHSHEQEFDADLLAFRWLLAVRRRVTEEQETHWMVRAVGTHIMAALEFFRLLRSVETRTGTAAWSESHPPAVERLLNLGAGLWDDLPEADRGAFATSVRLVSSLPPADNPEKWTGEVSLENVMRQLELWRGTDERWLQRASTSGPGSAAILWVEAAVARGRTLGVMARRIFNDHSEDALAFRRLGIDEYRCGVALGGETTWLAAGLYNLAIDLTNWGRFDEAIVSAQEALELRVAASDPDVCRRSELVDTYRLVGLLACSTGDQKRGVRLLLSGLELCLREVTVSAPIVPSMVRLLRTLLENPPESDSDRQRVAEGLLRLQNLTK